MPLHIFFRILTRILARKATLKDGFKNFSRATGSTIQKSKLILVATIFASTIGGGTTFGIAEKTFADNISYSYGQ